MFHTWKTIVFIFINDLPDENSDIEGFGFVVDYKLIVHDQTKSERSAKKNLKTGGDGI